MSGKEKISEQLSAYLDGELSQAESRRVDEMVAADPALSAELESLRAVQSLVRGLPPAQAPDGMADAILERAQRRGAGWWAGHLARAAVILLAVGIGVIVTARLNKPAQQNETQTPHPSKTPVLAKGKIADVSGVAMAGITNVFINTDNLLLTQREVEGVFGKNSIKPVVEAETVRMTKAAPESRGRANFYSQTQVAPTQIRYEVVIEENQMRQIVSELNEIRAKQNVAQMPMKYGHIRNGDAIALAEANDRSESVAGRASRHAAYRKDKDEKKRSVEKAHLARSAGAGTAEDTASQPAPAIATRRPGLERSRASAAKPSTGPTTMPAPAVVALRPQVGADAKQQTATLARANVRQLVVILNVVGGE